jgi:hypothetical protein
MSQPADPLTREPGRRLWVAALIALTLAGCGAASDPLSHAIGGAAQAARATTRFSQQLMRSWCPPAVAAAGRRLTEAQARECLRQAWGAWLHELRRNGYDPSRVGR